MADKVLFRKWRGTKDVFAVFPELPGDYDWRSSCLCYDHEGHNSIDISAIRTGTVAAKPSEYTHLRSRLEKLGYAVQVVPRITQRMTQARRERVGFQYGDEAKK